MSLPSGASLGPYVITRALGAGGMGEVYSARDPRLDREVAIKVLRGGHACSGEYRRRFEQEARAVARLNHPNVIAIYDVGHAAIDDAPSGAPFLVMEILDGRTLGELIRDGPLAPERVSGYLRQIVAGLSAAHAKGVIHRDLKPANLFITTDDVVKILDFGLAKFRVLEETPTRASALQEGTRPGEILGTVAYVSPEQARGEPIDSRSDVFSIGVVAYEALTGRNPFRRASAAETLSAILSVEPESLSPAILSSEFAGLWPIVQRCLEKAPPLRFQSAEDLASALRALSHPSPRPARLQRGAWLGAAIMALAVLVAVTLPSIPHKEATVPLPAFHAPRVTPFLSSASVEEHPAWSPKGDLIAYVSDESGNSDVWISDPAGGRRINLTAGYSGVDSFPAWSPDAQKIAFFSTRNGGGIFTMSPLGGAVQSVTPVSPAIAYTFSLKWAGSRSLLYTALDASARKHLYRVPVEGGKPECLTCPIAAIDGARAGDVSPSGELLAFATSAVDGRAAIYVLNLRSRGLHKVAEQADWPAWIGPRELAFISARDGVSDLWSRGVDEVTGVPETGVQRLTSGLNVSVSGPFSVGPGGASLLAVKDKTTAELWAFPVGVAPITSLERGTRLTSGEFRDVHPRWLADDQGLVFQSDRRGAVDVWVLGGPGQVPTQLTSLSRSGELTNVRQPEISPDGRWVAIEVVGGRGVFPYIVRADGTGFHPISDALARFQPVCCHDFSPTSGELAVSFRPDGGPRVISIVDMDWSTGTTRGAVRPVVRGPLDYPRWSPDGRFLAYELLDGNGWDIWITDTEGRSARRLTTFAGNERSAAWQSNPLTLYFRRDFNEIWRMPMNADGRPLSPPVLWMKIPGKTFDHGGLDFSTRGDRAVTSILTRASDIWLVEFPEGAAPRNSLSPQPGR